MDHSVKITDNLQLLTAHLLSTLIFYILKEAKTLIEKGRMK
jgi:hypothetical protein